jgi:hypothetical protein
VVTWRRAVSQSILSTLRLSAALTGVGGKQVIWKYESYQEYRLDQAVEVDLADLAEDSCLCSCSKQLAQATVHGRKRTGIQIGAKGSAGGEPDVLTSSVWGGEIDQRQTHIGRVGQVKAGKLLDHSLESLFRVRQGSRIVAELLRE